ncbi:MAG: hypothetical protein AAF589_07040 [Planctomycetota bacterium]
MSETFSADPNAYEPPQGDAKQKKGWGCFAYGCLGLVLLTVLVVVGGGLAAYFGIRGAVQAYTAEAPAEIPVVEASEEELAEIQERIDNLTAAAEAGAAPPDMELTADDLNALIAANEDLKGKVFVRIEGGKVGGDVSMPADALPGGKDRHFNASASFNVYCQDGTLIVTLADAEVNGEPLPPQFTEALASENLAKEFASEPEVQKFLQNVESIEVKEDKIILRGKKADAPPAGSADPPAVEVPAETAPAGE